MIAISKRLMRTMLLAAVAVAACRCADLYPVAGIVLNTETNSPLAHARVNLYRSTAAKPVADAITGDNGRFQFQVSAGSYRMLAGTRDTLENYGSRHAGNPVGSAVIVGPGKDTASLIFRFFPPAAISGRVVDDAGEPVRNALVELIRSTVAQGRRYTTVYAFDRTNDLGEYRLSRLPGETSYFLSVTAEPWYAQSDPIGQPATQPAVAYAPTYYPNTADDSKAVPILLKPGQEARADFALIAVANATLTVRYDAPPGMRGTISLSREGLAGNPIFQQSQQLAGFARPAPGSPQETPRQSQILKGVPPGHYTATIAGAVGAAMLGAKAVVDVNGSDTTVDLPLKPMPKITGTVHLPSGAVPGGTVLVSLRLNEARGTASATVQPDGTFIFPNVIPGRFSFTLGGSGGFFATGIEVRGGTLKDGLVEVSEGGDVTLSITASNETGELRGFVMDGDNPLAGVLVVLAPLPGQSGEAYSEARYRSFQTESDGSFDFRPIPAGRYLLFAIDDSQFEYARPEVVAPYLSRAREVGIRPRTSAEERIPLSPPIAQ